MNEVSQKASLSETISCHSKYDPILNSPSHSALAITMLPIDQLPVSSPVNLELSSREILLSGREVNLLSDQQVKPSCSYGQLVLLEILWMQRT